MRARSRTSARSVSAKIEVKQAEVAQIRRNQVLQYSFAATLAEEDFVAHENICRAAVCCLHLRDEAVGLGECPHQKALQHIADQGAGELARQPLQRRRIFFKETGEFARHLVLLAKQVRRVFVENFALLVGQRDTFMLP